MCLPKLASFTFVRTNGSSTLVVKLFYEKILFCVRCDYPIILIDNLDDGVGYNSYYYFYLLDTTFSPFGMCLRCCNCCRVLNDYGEFNRIPITETHIHPIKQVLIC